jgi:hypothetical protein
MYQRQIMASCEIDFGFRRGSARFSKQPFLSASGGRSPRDTRYLCISMPDIFFWISFILSCIFFISFVDILPRPIALDISII